MFRLSIVTPSKIITKNLEVKSLKVPGHEGQLEILDLHSELITELTPGIVEWVDAQGETNQCTMTTGYLQVNGDELNIISQVSEKKDDIDIERAKKAQTNAESKLNEDSLDDKNHRKHQLKLQRAIIRQTIAG